jgi:hypothetical protein
MTINFSCALTVIFNLVYIFFHAFAGRRSYIIHMCYTVLKDSNTLRLIKCNNRIASLIYLSIFDNIKRHYGILKLMLKYQNIFSMISECKFAGRTTVSELT